MWYTYIKLFENLMIKNQFIWIMKYNYTNRYFSLLIFTILRILNPAGLNKVNVEF
jgi:hypothetical protein